MDLLYPILRSDPFVIIESNAILRFITPDICIFVLRYDIEEFKDSAQEMLGQADAAVALGRGSYSPPWESIANEALVRVPLFAIEDPQAMPRGFIEWMGAQLAKSGGQEPSGETQQPAAGR